MKINRHQTPIQIQRHGNDENDHHHSERLSRWQQEGRDEVHEVEQVADQNSPPPVAGVVEGGNVSDLIGARQHEQHVGGDQTAGENKEEANIT